MGPTSAVPDLAQLSPGGRRRIYVPIHIGAERKGVLRWGFIDLELSLSSTPPPSWVGAFELATSDKTSLRSFISGRPTIERNHIVWSIPERELLPAWEYIRVCIDSANVVGRYEFRQPPPENLS